MELAPPGWTRPALPPPITQPGMQTDSLGILEACLTSASARLVPWTKQEVCVPFGT